MSGAKVEDYGSRGSTSYASVAMSRHQYNDVMRDTAAAEYASRADRGKFNEDPRAEFINIANSFNHDRGSQKDLTNLLERTDLNNKEQNKLQGILEHIGKEAEHRFGRLERQGFDVEAGREAVQDRIEKVWNDKTAQHAASGDTLSGYRRLLQEPGETKTGLESPENHLDHSRDSKKGSYRDMLLGDLEDDGADGPDTTFGAKALKGRASHTETLEFMRDVADETDLDPKVKQVLEHAATAGKLNDRENREHAVALREATEHATSAMIMNGKTAEEVKAVQGRMEVASRVAVLECSNYADVGELKLHPSIRGTNEGAMRQAADYRIARAVAEHPHERVLIELEVTGRTIVEGKTPRFRGMESQDGWYNPAIMALSAKRLAEGESFMTGGEYRFADQESTREWIATRMKQLEFTLTPGDGNAGWDVSRTRADFAAALTYKFINRNIADPEGRGALQYRAQLGSDTSIRKTEDAAEHFSVTYERGLINVLEGSKTNGWTGIETAAKQMNDETMTREIKQGADGLESLERWAGDLAAERARGAMEMPKGYDPAITWREDSLKNLVRLEKMTAGRVELNPLLDQVRDMERHFERDIRDGLKKGSTWDTEARLLQIDWVEEKQTLETAAEAIRGSTRTGEETSTEWARIMQSLTHMDFTASLAHHIEAGGSEGRREQEQQKVEERRKTRFTRTWENTD